MASDAQKKANRANAARSTGPRTAKGKARSALNGLIHGGAAFTPLLPDENRAAYYALRAAYFDHFRPDDEIASFLVARLALDAWRLHRLAALEPRVLSVHFEAAAAHRSWASGIGDLLRGMFSQPIRPARPSAPPADPVAHAYVRDSERGNAVTKLARYQTATERSYLRTLHELQRLHSPAAVAPSATSAPLLKAPP